MAAGTAAGLLLAAPSAQAAGTWLAGAMLTPSGDNLQSYEPQIAMDAAGNATAVWIRKVSGASTATVETASRPAGGSWSSVEPLGVPFSYFVNPPQLAVDGAGDAVVVWEEGVYPDGVIWAAYRKAGSATWTVPNDPLSATGGAAPRVGIDAVGNAAAIWMQYDSGTSKWKMQDSLRPAATGLWAAAKDLSGETSSIGHLSLAVDAAGDAVGAWEGPTSQVAFGSTKTGTWGPPTDPRAGSPGTTPRVGVNRQGKLVIAWVSADSIYIRIGNAATGALQEVQSKSVGAGRRVLYANVAVSQGGDALVTFVDQVTGMPATLKLEAATVRGDVLGSPETLDGPDAGLNTGEPTPVVEDDRGGAVVAYLDGTVIRSRTRTAGSSVWSAVQLVGNGTLPILAGDPAGDAAVTWVETSGKAIDAAGYDGAGPVFTAVSIPPSGRKGAALSFSLASYDVWSTLNPPTWSFGDGTATATGSPVTHAYAAAGTYVVTLSQSDAAGNTTTTTRRLTITARTPPPPPPPPIVKCQVPNVKGKKLAFARNAIRRAHCRVGKVTRAYSRKVKRGRVLKQRPRARAVLVNGARVNLVVSRGRRR